MRCRLIGRAPGCYPGGLGSSPSVAAIYDPPSSGMRRDLRSRSLVRSPGCDSGRVGFDSLAPLGLPTARWWDSKPRLQGSTPCRPAIQPRRGSPCSVPRS